MVDPVWMGLDGRSQQACAEVIRSKIIRKRITSTGSQKFLVFQKLIVNPLTGERPFNSK
jgi:hypothetical protein